MKKARAFAKIIIKDNYDILTSSPFINYWNVQTAKLTRSKLKATETQQALRQVQTYADIVIEESSSSDETEGSEYQRSDSVPSSSSSTMIDYDETKQYLTHDGDTYHYKLKENSVRWLVNNYDVSQAFFDYRDAAISKAEDLKTLNDHEQLALDGIMLIDNSFLNTDIVDYEEAQNVLNDIDQVADFNIAPMNSIQDLLIIKFANDLASRNINVTAIKKYIKEYEDKYPNDTTISTLVRDTIDTFFKSFFPNSSLTKSVGADTMILDSSKRFTRLDPSLKNYGKRADFSVVSTKTGHLLLSLEAKSNQTKHINDTLKLCRELKDSMKAINNDGHSAVYVCGILMKGNRCHVYCMDHVFDGMYRVVLLKSVLFPSDCYQIYQLLPIFPLFRSLQTIVQSSALKLRNRSPLTARPLDSIVSMHTPTIVRISKRKVDKNDPAVQHAR
ncbi:hypothetical protein BDF21DRAFT_458791 [Thamnidium elegans]|nr:hypothetical protein BDF21DRAFT_458791 [Thamnidium elegans]